MQATVSRHARPRVGLDRIRPAIPRPDDDDLGPARGFALSLVAGATLWAGLVTVALRFGQIVLA